MTDTSTRPLAHPVVAFAQRAIEVVASLSEAQAWALSPDEQARVLVDLNTLGNQVAELELRVLAAADNNGVGSETAAPSTASWLATTTVRPVRDVRADVRLAHALDTDFRATAAAMATGGVNVDQARVIVNAVKALPAEEVTAEERRLGEAHLIARAAEFDAPALRRLGDRLLEVLAPERAEQLEADRLAAEEAAAKKKRSLRMVSNGDGTVTGKFKIPELHAGMLDRALRGLVGARRVGNDARQDATTGNWLPTDELLGQGFCELLENYPADQLPKLNGVNAQVVVTMTLEQLTGGPGGLAAATLDGTLGTHADAAGVGTAITAGTARRLACEAGIVPLVLGGDSEVLDLGRARRFHTTAQRIAIRHRDKTCTAEDCRVPGYLCHVHHDEIRWVDGAGTSVEKARLLCSWHHQRIHDDTYLYERLPSGGVRFTRRT